MITKLNIINNALMQLGHAPVASLIDQDELVVSAETIFDSILPSILSQGGWRFATKVEQLSQLVETPPKPYLYVYALPSGWLKTLSVWPNTYDWDIFHGNKIYTFNEGEWYMQFIYQPDVSALPYYFTDYFAHEIAARLCLSNAEKTDYTAAINSERNRLLAIAHAVDTQNRPQFTQVDFPVIGKRYIGGIYSNITVS